MAMACSGPCTSVTALAMRSQCPPSCPLHPAAGDLEQLQAEHIYPQARCKVSGVAESSTSVSFQEVSG